MFYGNPFRWFCVILRKDQPINKPTKTQAKHKLIGWVNYHIIILEKTPISSYSNSRTYDYTNYFHFKGLTAGHKMSPLLLSWVSVYVHWNECEKNLLVSNYAHTSFHTLNLIFFFNAGGFYFSPGLLWEQILDLSSKTWKTVWWKVSQSTFNKSLSRMSCRFMKFACAAHFTK